MAKYDKDQYQILLRKLDALKQTTSVLEYQTTFEKLVHGIVLYNPAFDDTFFVTRFVSGLRDEIRVPLLLHRSHDVDTASTLALIQEQQLEVARSKSSGRDITRGFAKQLQSADKLKAFDNGKHPPKGQMQDTEDKLATLKAFRYRNGLCFKCGEKWSPNHKCPPHISLHVLEEILEAMEISGYQEEDDNEVEVVTEEQEVMALQSVLVAKTRQKHTMKLLAKIGKHNVLVVDSGNVWTFVNTQLVQHLKIPTVACKSSTFRAADGGLMLCDQMVPKLKWCIQGQEFCFEAKVLSLKYVL